MPLVALHLHLVGLVFFLNAEAAHNGEAIASKKECCACVIIHHLARET
jgi:cytochrome c551/c552